MRRLAVALALLPLHFAPCGRALAHEVRPAYLELRQSAPETWDVMWRVPALGEDLRLGLYVELPAGAVILTEPQAVQRDNAYEERWSFQRPGGLAGQIIRIAGLSATSTDVLVRITRLDGSTQSARVLPKSPSFVVESSPHPLSVARTYLVLGVEHIWLGVDHLLFVLGLLLVVGGRRLRLVKTITAFTVAHSITLALATLGFVHVPSAPVEAVIALSIMFVAAEALHARAGRPGLTARTPWIVAFVFGLLHGFGFASALAQVGLPQTAIPLALVLFNVGVELGQLAFVALMLGLAVLLQRWRWRERWPAWVDAVPPYAIGGCAAYWTLERVASFFGG